MKQNRIHTIETRQIASIVMNNKRKQARLRMRWMELDIINNALEHRIDDILGRLRK